MNNKKLLILDAGHGSIDFDGNYTTAPAKMYNHPKKELHREGWFYEGVGNRILTSALSMFALSKGYQVINLHDNMSDTSLRTRVSRANKAYQKNKNCILISMHSNAFSDSSVRGFELYTTVGQTKSDILAKDIYNAVYTDHPELEYRINHKLKPDKEKNFYILRKTLPPAVLIEFEFFSHPDAVELLNDPEWCFKMCKSVFEGIHTYFNK